MKTTSAHLTSFTLALALTAGLHAQDAPKPAADSAAPPAPKAAPQPAEKKTTAITIAKPPAPKKTAANGPQLRLNFRGAPLDMVLNYMSEAAGYTIVLETPVKGTVDVWSNTPLTKDEAVELLNSALNKNGYAALVNGRTMTILAKDEARRRDIPVKSGSNPDEIPKNDQIVTQIIPVRYINATQVTKDLAPLLPTSTSITANESGNALVLTDTQMNIHRVAEIVSALDSAVSGVTQIKVYPLKYADAKALAATVKDLLTGGSSSSRDPRSAIASAIASRFGGGGPGGGPGGGGPGGDSGGGRSRSGGGGAAAATFVAVADEYSNSLIVSAPDEKILAVDELIKQVDQPVEDVSELRVFHLKNADPLETADLLMQLFPDPNASNSRSSSSRTSGFTGFPGFPGAPGGDSRSRSGGGSSDSSDRARKQSKVSAVADPRTSSVIVTASKDMMAQISEMILQLDSSTAKKQKVFVYSLENAETQQVEQVLRDLFESQNSKSSSSQTKNALDTRANNSAQQQGNATSSGFGTAGGFGGSGGGAPR